MLRNTLVRGCVEGGNVYGQQAGMRDGLSFALLGWEIRFEGGSEGR